MGVSTATAQEEQHTISEAKTHHRGDPHGSRPRLTRWEASIGGGLTAGALTGSHQSQPAIQTSVGYALNPRITLGLAYGRAVFTPSAFVDKNRVVSQETSVDQHYGVRMKGVFLRKRVLRLYGGVQLGVTTSEQTYVHTFPTEFMVENEEFYLDDRATPFFSQGPQIGAIGFMGVGASVLSCMDVYAELGNNLALLSGGITFKF